MEFHAGDIVEVKDWDDVWGNNYNPFVVLGKPSEDYYLIYSEAMNENEDGHEGWVYANTLSNGEEFGHWYISGLCLSLVMPAKKWSKEDCL